MAEPTPVAAERNPYPGLRPFRTDEERLFFGREHQVDRMIDELAANRFLAVVGGSGSGKSSLVNCGLRPALHRGNMASVGAVWRMAQFRPGNDPIGALAGALAAPGVLFEKPMTGALSAEAMVEATLQLGSLGLVDMVEQAHLPVGTQMLVVVDQFEELFRFRSLARNLAKDSYGPAEDAVAFVRLLLEARAQTRVPIHVVLTMRSDFLGDCSQFQGLPEAINEGQYLVPRLTRDEIRAAITGPTAVAGATISSVLVTRLLNDVGDNPDQLSILQHALNRTWSRWEGSGEVGPLDLPHYQSIGTMTRALDKHAEKAYAELKTARHRQICEKLFKALTDKATDPRGVRRPTRLDTLCALAEATPEEITQVIDVFRKPSRSFLMPPAGDALDPETVIDISHESLMRVWERLKGWSDEEAQSAQTYRRLAQTAVLYREGKAGLWDDPDLQAALDWQEKNQPNEVWAGRYHPEFSSAMDFLKKSKEVGDAEAAEIEFNRKMRNVRVLIICLVVGAWLADPLDLANRSLGIHELLPFGKFSEEWDERLARVAARIPEIFRLLVHFLGYFVLLFGLGAVIRKFAFGTIGKSALAESPWGTRWQRFQVGADELQDRFESPRSKLISGLGLLVAGVVSFGFGLFSFVRDSGTVLRYGVPVGLILILLIPTDGILRRSWALGLKVAQGILLQVGGAYALIGLFYLLISTDVWSHGLLLVQSRWVLAIAGVSLLIVGARKQELTAEETLLRQADQAPVLHLQSFGDENRNRKETWVSWLRRFFWPNDDQILRPIFGVLGPFVTLAYGKELSQPGPVTNAGAIPDDLQDDATRLTRRSALVILQIDNRLTYGFLSQIRQTLQSLKQTLSPDQVLVYFSQKIDAAKLNVAYQKFVEGTEDVFPGVWPASIESNRFLAFDDEWKPFLCGPLTIRKFSWTKLMPLLGHRLDAARMSRAIARALRPYFERRNLVDPGKKLFGDRAIGLSSFQLFDLGLPAGVMICINLWGMQRKWAAVIGLFAPILGVIATLSLGVFLIALSLSYEALTLESTAFLTMVILGFPFATYWLWRRWSGRAIRQHIALGGTTQPVWKVLLVVLIAGGWLFTYVALGFVLLLSF